MVFIQWEKSRIKICTYNVRNLFLAEEGEPKEAKAVRSLGRMIEQIDADILVLQEVGSLASLQSLNDRLACPYAHTNLVPGNSDRSIHIAVFSRLPVRLTSHRHLNLKDASGAPLLGYVSEADAQLAKPQPLKVQRDILLIEIDSGISLFAVHLKSRLNKPWQLCSADDIRSGECRALGYLLREYRLSHPAGLLVALGDFNDPPKSDVFNSLHDAGMIDPMDESLLRAGRHPTTYWPKRRMRLDRIFVHSDHLGSVVTGSPTIHNNRMAQVASDHYAVSIELQI